MNIKHIILSVLTIMPIVATAQTEVEPYKPGITEDGITYFLPVTKLHITVKAKRTTYVPGEFCEYAERYLRLQDVTQQRYDKWTLMGVDVTPFGVADKRKAYTIKVKTKTSAPLVGLSADGRLLSINTPAPRDVELTKPGVVKEKDDQQQGKDYKTEEILAAGSTMKMAELAANEIYDIRENRSLLAKGQADFMPKDGEQLKLMLDNLNKQEDGLLSLFKGTQTSETETFTFDYTPTKEVKDEVLFRFSTKLGVLDKDDLAGVPIYINIENESQLPTAAEAEKNKNKSQDLRYVVPANIGISIFEEDNTLWSKTVPMAQFGNIEHLGGDLFNKRFTTKVTLSPSTGGIVKVEGEENK